MLHDEFDKFSDDSERKRLEIDGVIWEYFVTGSGDKTVLVLTGGGSVAESAFIYVNALATKFRVITPTIPAVHTVEESLAGIAAILDQEAAPKVSILGFSMGGMLAQCFVRKWPQIVFHLVMFVSMLPSPAYARKYAKYKRGIGIVPEFLFKIISKYSLRKRVLSDKGSASEEDIQFWIEFFNWEFDSGKMNKQALLATSDILIDYFSNNVFTTSDLAKWSGKVLLFESDHDEVISKLERDRFKATYPQAEIAVQTGSGHFGEGLLNPSKSIQTIMNFLSR